MKKDRIDQFSIPGPAGQLQVEVDWPRELTAGEVTVIVSHPHPLYHGSMHNKVVTTISKAFRSLGASVVRYNFRGVGQSEGSYGNGEGEVADLVAVANWVRQHKPGQPLLLAGFSFGASVAYKGAGQLDTLHGLLTVAPAITRFPVEDAAVPEAPWCIIQGDDDEVVDPQAVFEWLLTRVSRAYVLRKLSGTGHFFHGRLVDLRTEIINHYQNLLRG